MEFEDALVVEQKKSELNFGSDKGYIQYSSRS